MVCTAQYCSVEQTKKNEMGGACSRRGAYGVLAERPEGNRPLGRPRLRSEDNIKIDL